MTPFQSALNPTGSQAAQLAHLFWIFTIVCTVAYVLVLVFFFGAVARSRRNAMADVSDEREASHHRTVSAAAAVSIIGLLALLVVSISVGASVGTFGRGRADQMEVEVTGHQWWWEVKYPDALSPYQQIVDANEIHIPVHTPVLLRLDTRDVIHSLWIPNLHGKRDLIPGRVNKFWIEADKPGVYRGQCAEFCGLQHAHMSLAVIAETPEDFARWKTNVGAGAKAPQTAAQLRGQQVFLRAPCGKCHNILGLDAYGSLGPDLTHVHSRTTLAAGTLLNTRGNLAGWITNAPAIKPGTMMPPNQVSGQELQDLLAYLETLK